MRRARPKSAARSARPGERIAGEAGVTLIELLVGLVVSTVVALALFAIIEFSFRQTYSVAERVNANQRGRLAMEEILQRLHSSCVAVSAVPVQTPSNETNLYLLSQEGTQPSFSSMTKHQIYLSGTTLYDASYISTGGVAPHWTFPATPTSTSTLLTNVSQSGATPVFSYFKYETGGVLSTTPLAVPLTETTASTTDAVKIAFTVAPATSTRAGGPTRSVELTDTVLLRFDPSSTTGQNKPCT
jgi:Tfp pilus assembly protein PilV